MRAPWWILVGALLSGDRGWPLKAAATRFEIAVSGCAAVRTEAASKNLADSLCEVAEGQTLRIFAASPPPIAVEVDGKPISVAAQDVPGGVLLRVPVETSAKRLGIRKGDARSFVRLAPASLWSWLEEARALRSQGNLDDAVARLQGARSSANRVERALAIGLFGRIELSRGAVESAIESLRASSELHRQEGRISDQAEDAFALSFALNQRSHRFVEAAQVLDAIAPVVSRYPDGQAKLPFNRAEVALEAGDVRRAIYGLREALFRSQRLGLAKMERNARTLLATALQIEGHVREGIDELRALDRELARIPDAHPCEKAEVLINLGFSIARMADSSAAVEPAERALALFPTSCPDPYLRRLALHVTALAAIDSGHIAEASRHLEASRTSTATERVSDRLHRLELEARIAKATHNHAHAKSLFRELAIRATALHQSDRLLAARIGEGEILESEGDRKGALAAYKSADRVLDDKTLALPLGEGRGLLLAQNDRAARLAIDLLARTKKPDEAFAIARHARRRALLAAARVSRIDNLDPEKRKAWEAAVLAYRHARANLDAHAKDDWKLASRDLAATIESRASELSAVRRALDDALAAIRHEAREDDVFAQPAPGEVWLTVHRGQNALLAFAATNERVQIAKVNQAADVLRTFHDEIAIAKRVVVLAHDDLRRVDLHALLFDGAPLIELVPVVYAVDAGTPNAFAAAQEEPPRALLVADPTGDLAFTRAEIRSVEQQLHARGFTTNVLQGEFATRTTMADRFAEGTTFFHYAGHGSFGGMDGVDARLLLASNSSLGVLDILALPRVPHTVVLSACDAALNGSGPVEGLGIAQSFILAGSDQVIAPTRKVDDSFAQIVADEIYRATLDVNRTGHSPSADEALRTALAQARKRQPEKDWTAYRALRR